MKSNRLRLKIVNVYKNIEIYKMFFQMAQHKYCLEAIIYFLSKEVQIFKSYVRIFILPCKTASQSVSLVRQLWNLAFYFCLSCDTLLQSLMEQL